MVQVLISTGTTNMVRGWKSDNIFTSVLTVLKGISDTKQVLIEYVMTERDFKIETFSARPVIHPFCLALPSDLFTDSVLPHPPAPLPSLAFGSLLPFTECWCVPYGASTKVFPPFSLPLPHEDLWKHTAIGSTDLILLQSSANCTPQNNIPFLVPLTF